MRRPLVPILEKWSPPVWVSSELNRQYKTFFGITTSENWDLGVNFALLNSLNKGNGQEGISTVLRIQTRLETYWKT